MTYRKHPIVTGEIYHVFNRSVGQQPIFLNKNDFRRAIELIRLYRYHKPPLRFSHFNRLSIEEKSKFLTDLENNSPKQISLMSFCLIPNHFHFLIKQLEDLGISNFLSNFQNSYAKYFNTKNKRNGALFQSVFKAVRIESDEQFIHVCRYIHLNPYSSFVLQRIEDLENYLWSSLPDFLGKQDSGIVEKSFVLDYFSSIEKFRSFTYDQADYQRKLKEIKYFTFE